MVVAEEEAVLEVEVVGEYLVLTYTWLVLGDNVVLKLFVVYLL
jgi:hypothetical protein